MDRQVRRTHASNKHYASFITAERNLRTALHQEIMRYSLTAQPLETLMSDAFAMDISSALNKFHLFGTSDRHDYEFEGEDRLRISRTRRAIDLHEQELIQLALLEERQKSA